MTTVSCATTTWTINNFRYCWHKNNEEVVSPVFCTNMPEETKWKILLFPRGVAGHDTCISLFLYRDIDCTAADEIEVEYTLDIVDIDGVGVVDLPGVVKFRKGMQSGSPRYIHLAVATVAKAWKYLPNDTLTIRCKMFQCDGEVVRKQQVFARTIIGFEKRFIRWMIDDFFAMMSEQPGTFFIKSTTNDAKIELNLSGTDGDKETILFGMTLLDPSVKFYSVKAFILNTQNQEVDSGEFEYWFESGSCRMFPLKHTIGRLIRNKGLYLPDNILTFCFEVTFSSGFAFEGLERAAPECHPISNEVFKDRRKCITHDKMADCPCALITDLHALHKDISTCDVILATKSVKFLVHSLILSARSPVFKAMFSNEMMKGTKGCVYVPDLSDNIVCKFILYLYSDQLEDLKWEDALELYEAASKFVVKSLEVKCCIYLKDILNLENACKVLLFSDLYQERELKEFAQAFILKNARVVFKSEEWKILVQKNITLALETTLQNWDDQPLKLE